MKSFRIDALPPRGCDLRILCISASGAKRTSMNDETQGGNSQKPQKELSRPTAKEIYVQVARNARDELKRSALSLGISGLVGGIFTGFSGLGVAIALAQLGPSAAAGFIAQMFYPIGFIIVILGRAQLFTENTLYPVALLFAERKHFLRTLRLWAIVLTSNVLGALGFASLVSKTPAIRPAYLIELAHMGAEAVHQAPASVFWSAVVAGSVIAMVAWLVSASHSVTGSMMLIWVLTFVIGLGHFAHCIVGSSEAITAVLTHQIAWSSYLHWLALAVAGNVSGGVIVVTLLEYGQVIADEEGEKAISEDARQHKQKEASL
jgi:formate/nitrite transporter FocA (FNT family)